MANSKISRKVSRVVGKVCHELSISASSEATNCVLVCNAGLSTGFSLQNLWDIFAPHGQVLDIRMMQNKSYSFVQFSDVTTAQKAFDQVQGRGGGGAGPALYLCFVDAIPEVDSGIREMWSRHNWPDGLTVIEDFVSEQEAEDLVNSVSWCDDQSDGSLKHRQVRHFGFAFHYGSNSIDKRHEQPAFPSCWQPLLQRAMDQGLCRVMPDQCTVNRYDVGQGIPPHVDAHHCCQDTLMSLSLLSDVVMNMAPLSAGSQRPAVSLVLKARSLMVLQREARYAYSHGIPPRSYDILPAPGPHFRLTSQPRQLRMSLTFRKTLDSDGCECAFPEHCDAADRQKTQKLELDEAKARSLEKMHVHSVYDNIAHHFSQTRQKAWPKVAQFLASLEPGSILVDVGCGNGKYLGQNAHLFEIGCDFNQTLLAINRSRGVDSVRADCLQLPVRCGGADACICIAVIHHLATEDRRLQALSEVVRILRPGGQALVYVWAKNQDCSSYLKPTKGEDAEGCGQMECDTPLGLRLPVHRNRTNFRQQDVLVPWTRTPQPAPGEAAQQTQIYHRFYHVFQHMELEQLASRLPDIRIVSSYSDQGNFCIRFVKSS